MCIVQLLLLLWESVLRGGMKCGIMLMYPMPKHVAWAWYKCTVLGVTSNLSLLRMNKQNEILYRHIHIAGLEKGG